MQATITAKYVNMPKPGKKYASIKDTYGNLWYGEPAVIQQCQPGTTVTVQYSEQNWGGGPKNVVDSLSFGDGAGSYQQGNQGNQNRGGGEHQPPKSNRARERSIVAQSIIKSLGPEFNEGMADRMWTWHKQRVYSDPEEHTPHPQEQFGGGHGNGGNGAGAGPDLDDEIPFN